MVRSDDTSEPASGSDTPKAASLILSARAEALGQPLHDLLGRAVGEDAGDAEGRAEDGEPDAGVAPAISSITIGQQHAGGVAEGVGHEVERVQPDLGRLLDDGPGGLLPLVPLVGDGPNHVLGEVVDPLLDLELVLVELEGEVSHRARHLAGRSVR